MIKNILFVFLCSISSPLFAQDTFQLAPPLLKYGSIFFADKTDLAIKFAQRGTAVHYTINGNEPSARDTKYKKPISITDNFTTVKAKAFGNNFHPSATVAVTFIKDGKPIRSVEQTTANEKYPGSGAATLIDNKGGNVQTSSNTWMGYNCDTVNITVNLQKKETVNSVLLDLLQNEDGWIFLPEQILLYWYDKKSNSFFPFGKEVLFMEEPTPGANCNYRIINSKQNIKTSKILIRLCLVRNMPAWHTNKGEHAWMFIDEIKVY
jgi:hypothetical protein